MGPSCGRQDPDGPYVGPLNLAIWEYPAESLELDTLSTNERFIWNFYRTQTYHLT